MDVRTITLEARELEDGDDRVLRRTLRATSAQGLRDQAAEANGNVGLASHLAILKMSIATCSLCCGYGFIWLHVQAMDYGFEWSGGKHMKLYVAIQGDSDTKVGEQWEVETISSEEEGLVFFDGGTYSRGPPSLLPADISSHDGDGGGESAGDGGADLLDADKDRLERQLTLQVNHFTLRCRTRKKPGLNILKPGGGLLGCSRAVLARAKQKLQCLHVT